MKSIYSPGLYPFAIVDESCVAKLYKAITANEMYKSMSMKCDWNLVMVVLKCCPSFSTFVRVSMFNYWFIVENFVIDINNSSVIHMLLQIKKSLWSKIIWFIHMHTDTEVRARTNIHTNTVLSFDMRLCLLPLVIDSFVYDLC